MSKTHGAVFFCDDVREEVGGKQSYMGVLGPEIWVNGSVGTVNCVFLLWTELEEVHIKAEFTAENAPPELKLKPGFERLLRRPDDDGSPRWMVQMRGRYRVKIGEQPLKLIAKFAVGTKVFSNTLVIDRDIPEELANES